MKRFCACLLSAALLLSLSACGGEGEASSSDSSVDTSQEEVRESETATLTLAFYPQQSLHPALSANRANLTLAPLLYEGLFAVDGSFTAQPVLCESYTVSPDKLTWTFTLRGGVTFSDGTSLTGEVAAAALELARGEGSRYSGRLSHVTSITAGEGTVTVTLDEPNGSLPLLLDIPLALGAGERPVGTGPYLLSENGEEAELTARENWWQARQMPADTISLKIMNKSDEMIFAFDAGDISLVEVDLMGTNSLGYSGSYETRDYSTTSMIYLGFHTRAGLCQSAEVRKALGRGVDRESIARITYATHAVPSALPVHPDSPMYDRWIASQLSYDPEALVNELEALGAAGRELVLLVNTENMAKASAAQWIADQLESAGMKVRVDNLPFEEYISALEAGRFDLYLGEVALTADFDLSALLASDGALNYGRWQDEQTDQLLAALAAAPMDSREEAASALYAYLGQRVPLVPVCFKNNSVLTKWGRLSGLSPVRGNLFYDLENWVIS